MGHQQQEQHDSMVLHAEDWLGEDDIARFWERRLNEMPNDSDITIGLARYFRRGDRSPMTDSTCASLKVCRNVCSLCYLRLILGGHDDPKALRLIREAKVHMYQHNFMMQACVAPRDVYLWETAVVMHFVEEDHRYNAQKMVESWGILDEIEIMVSDIMIQD